jgi:hypothetical protein
MTMEQNDTARPREQANNEHARDACSTTTVVVLLRASEGVRHGVATVVANGFAQAGRVDQVVPNFKKRASFSSQPSAPSSGPEIAVVTTLHACDKKPHLAVAQAVVGSIE